MIEPRLLLRSMFDAAVACAQPSRCVPAALPQDRSGRLIIFGAGKASAEMAQAVEANWQGPISGLVVTRYGHAAPCRHVEVVEAAHPVPDAAGLRAAVRMLEWAQRLGVADQVLCLMSGGGSALLPLPGPGLSLDDKQIVAKALLRSGAGISEMNCVRRHLSGIKGGRLAAACAPATVHTLLISDVPGDDPVDIASGPTVADTSTPGDALAILDRYGIQVPSAVRRLLESGANDTVKPGDARLARATHAIIATPQQSLEAAAAVARDAGYPVCILGDAIEGEARDVGRVLAGIAQQVRRHRQPLAPPCVLLSGGETTVTVRGQGRGGRNVECLMGFGLALAGIGGMHALMADTDGVDGLEEIAGAVWSPDTLDRARTLGMDASARLADNDGHGFFEALGDSVVTGPTRTNVNDFRAVLIEA